MLSRFTAVTSGRKSAAAKLALAIAIRGDAIRAAGSARWMGRRTFSAHIAVRASILGARGSAKPRSKPGAKAQPEPNFSASFRLVQAARIGCGFLTTTQAPSQMRQVNPTAPLLEIGYNKAKPG